MIDAVILKIIHTMDLESGTSLESIASVEADLNCSLPDDYRQFAILYNGAEGWIGSEGYLRLWSVESLVSENRFHEVNRRAPGLVLFGGDGGGSGYAFDYRDSMKMRYVIVPLIGISLEHAYPCGKSFVEFLSRVGNATELPE